MALKKRDDTEAKVEEKVSSLGISQRPTKVSDKRQAIITFRIEQEYKDILTRHFKSIGTDLSSGIRMQILAYMKEKGLL